MTQKDINNQSIKDSRGNNGLDVNTSVNPFGQNRVAEIAYSKAERLAVATCLVTNFVSEDEHARTSVRKKSEELVALALDLRDSAGDVATRSTIELLACIRIILTLIDMLYASDCISRMNRDVLKNAYIDFGRFLVRTQDGTQRDAFVLDETYFVAPKRITDTKGQNYKGHFKEEIKDTVVVKDKERITDKKYDSELKAKEVSEKQTRARSVRTQRRASSRRMAILDVVTKRAPVHIKDIAVEVTDCSEKTIQRELASLVADGVVQKEGEKRWTTYSLVL